MTRGSTRRELLVALLGLPFAAASCRRGPRRGPRVPEGEIVGASHDLGHRVRDGLVPAVPADRWTRAAVAIVGGGIAGLSAAWRLERAGFRDFVLLELEEAAGGHARSGASRVTAYPWGAHYVPAPLKEDRALVALLDEMGVLGGRDAEGEPVVREEHLCRDPEERVFFKGRWYEGLYLHAGASREDLAQLAAFRAEVDRWAAWRDAKGCRAFAIPLARSSDDPEVTRLDREGFGEWVARRGWTSPRLRWLLDYACRDDYGMRLEETSAWAGLFYFAARLRGPGAEPRPLVTWPEGNGRIAAHLLAAVRPRVRLGLAAVDVASGLEAGRPAVRIVAVDRSGAARGFVADQVVFAASQLVARHAIRDWRAAPPAHLAEIEHGSWLVANLHVRSRPREVGFPLAWDNVLRESPSLGYVVATHQAGRDHGPTVLTYYHPNCDADPRSARARLLAMDHADSAELVLADLERAHPEIRGLVERLDVMRWGHAMVRPRPGFVWGSARGARRPWRGIHFANAELSGLPLLEEALHHGVRAAEEVLAARGVPFETML
ncbi:MAG: FAD-dependent oxidoreductase [Planctomycetes bacterium]|nr:FAD-dependent oxidoreductase [Planctomycetota bacterium]